jgi:hypothetical protein
MFERMVELSHARKVISFFTILDGRRFRFGLSIVDVDASEPLHYYGMSPRLGVTVTRELVTGSTSPSLLPYTSFTAA